MNRWTLKRVFVAGAFAAAIFAVTFVLGAGITAALGPGTSGIVTIVITTILIVVAARIVDAPGVFTLVVVIFSALAIPSTLFGPPGPQKIAVGLATGVVYDVVWLLLRRTRAAAGVAAALATAVSIGAIYALLIILKHPRRDYLQSMIMYLVPVYASLGFLGGWVGDWIYQTSLRNLGVVKQLAR